MNRGARILLIDDDGSLTTLLRRILAREGYKVELVQDLPGHARPEIDPPIASRQAVRNPSTFDTPAFLVPDHLQSNLSVKVTTR